MKTSKRILSLLLCMVMILGIIPVFASAEETTATITFNDVSKRTEWDAEHQIWVENGITVTNNRNGAQSAVVDSAKPVKFYAGSELIIKAPGNITKIEFACSSTSYATA